MRKTIYGIVLKKYLNGSKEEKSKMINGVIEVTGLNRKSVIRGLRNAQVKEPWAKFSGGRKTHYTPDSIAALKDIWLSANQCCGELLHAVISEYVEIFKRDKMWKHDSVATEVKRNTTGWKCLGRKGISTTTPSAIKSRIPVFQGDWRKVEVGTGQIDTVAHCGSSMAGDFIFSCGYVDVSSGWIEYRGQWNKGAAATHNSLNEIKKDLPFRLKMLHPDCGSEFLNRFVINWCEAENISVTRSRSYHKNDNGYIEQRNGHIVRKHFGYVRYDNQEILNHFNELAKLICTYHNHFVAQRLCIGTKENSAGRTRKVYESVASTSYKRLLSKNILNEKEKRELTQTHMSLNPKLMLGKITKMKHTLITKNH